jgi:hypothetical protein
MSFITEVSISEISLRAPSQSEDYLYIPKLAVVAKDHGRQG